MKNFTLDLLDLVVLENNNNHLLNIYYVPKTHLKHTEAFNHHRKPIKYL